MNVYLYHSKVCTPLLCPKPATASTSASDIETTVAASTMASSKMTVSSAAQPGKGDAIGALLKAIFGKEDMPELGEFRVHFPDGLTGQELDELLRQATAGLDFTTDILAEGRQCVPSIPFAPSLQPPRSPSVD
jgi:hypothetical protein